MHVTPFLDKKCSHEYRRDDCISKGCTRCLCLIESFRLGTNTDLVFMKSKEHMVQRYSGWRLSSFVYIRGTYVPRRHVYTLPFFRYCQGDRDRFLSKRRELLSSVQWNPWQLQLQIIALLLAWHSVSPFLFLQSLVLSSKLMDAASATSYTTQYYTDISCTRLTRFFQWCHVLPHHSWVDIRYYSVYLLQISFNHSSSPSCAMKKRHQTSFSCMYTQKVETNHYKRHQWDDYISCKFTSPLHLSLFPLPSLIHWFITFIYLFSPIVPQDSLDTRCWSCDGKTPTLKPHFLFPKSLQPPFQALIHRFTDSLPLCLSVITYILPRFITRKSMET